MNEFFQQNIVLLYWLLGGLILLILGISFRYWYNTQKVSKQFWDNQKVRILFYGSKKKGKEKFFYRNGKINKIQFWKNHLLDGKSVVYYPNGNTYIMSMYKNGKLDGEFIVLTNNGIKLYEANYSNGIKTKEEYFKINETRKEYNKTFDALHMTVICKDLKDNFNLQKDEYNVIKEKEETRDEKKEITGFFSVIGNIAKKVTGVQAYNDRKSGIALKEICEIYLDSANNVTEDARKKLESTVSSFGKQRLSTLHKTTGKFLSFLKDMNQSNKVKEYEFLESIGINTNALVKMEKIDMEVSKALQSTATVGMLGAVAAMGTPTLVTTTVGALATASTGTAISSLSGVAATNATLAWLGGGSLAAGGGGMAAGAATLSLITIGATAGIAALASGLIASTHYSKKLTEVKKFQKEVEIQVALMEKLWVTMEGINDRVKELENITFQLEEKLINELHYLEPLVIDFNFENDYYTSIFQKTGILVKSMNELSETPLLDDEGAVSRESGSILSKTKTILNTDLINYA